MPKMYLKTDSDNDNLLFIEGSEVFIPWLKRRLIVRKISAPSRNSSYFTVIIRRPDTGKDYTLEYTSYDVRGYGEYSRSPFEGVGTFLFTDG